MPPVGDFRLFGPAASAGPAAVLGDVTKTYWCPQGESYRKAVVRGGTAMTIEPGVVDQRAQTDDVHVEQVDPRGEYGAVSVVDDGTWITLRGNHTIPLRQLTAAVDELEPLAKRR